MNREHLIENKLPLICIIQAKQNSPGLSQFWANFLSVNNTTTTTATKSFVCFHILFQQYFNCNNININIGVSK